MTIKNEGKKQNFLKGEDFKELQKCAKKLGSKLLL